MLRVLVLCLLLTGCGGIRNWIKPPPVPATCASECFAPCDTTRPLWEPVNPEDPAAWDDIRPQVVEPLVKNLRTCEVRRRACESCLRRLEQAAVIAL